MSKEIIEAAITKLVEEREDYLDFDLGEPEPIPEPEPGDMWPAVRTHQLPRRISDWVSWMGVRVVLLWKHPEKDRYIALHHYPGNAAETYTMTTLSIDPTDATPNQTFVGVSTLQTRNVQGDAVTAGVREMMREWG